MEATDSDVQNTLQALKKLSLLQKVKLDFSNYQAVGLGAGEGNVTDEGLKDIVEAFENPNNLRILSLQFQS